MLSRSASGVGTLQRALALSRNCSALESGHSKAKGLPTVVDVVMIMHSVVRGSDAATFAALVVLEFFNTLLLELL